ncbi:pyocin knob domain-containing protein [Chryseobacterium scophthalmum]|uniref:pyocin knob domain-containing protein n=1 Tax=Chryseobacterium scophthalmum TaxID=59733 RepID=UPI001AEC453F|nr:pyocin knob domain-containing protein [Chryseobacterium scophthalmum]
MEENEEFDSDFNPEDIPISEEFWNYMENYWHNNREFPESTEASLNRKADLVDGKVPSSQLPSYVDDVLEYDTFESLPNSGEKGKIYVITNNNTQFRWSGSEYIQLNSDEYFMTTDTIQYINPSGTKNFYTEGGRNYYNNSLWIRGNSDGSAITFADIGVGQIRFNNDNFYFTGSGGTNYIPLYTGGIIKENSNDDYILTGGGGHELKSNYLLSTEGNNRYFPRSTDSNSVIDLNNLTLEGVYYGYQWLNVPISTIATATVKIYSHDWIRQEYSPIDGSGVTYIRDRHSGTTWGDWKLIVNKDWIDTQAFFNNNKIESKQVPIVATTLDAELPNGGFITSYYTHNWSGADAPSGASYGGFIKFGDVSNGNNGLQLYYNNGHGGADSHRLWFRTKNSTVGTTNWFEVATVQSLNGYVRTTGDQNIDGIKGFTGAYSQWILNGDGSNARGFIQSLSNRFGLGTLNDKDVVIYRNSVEKVIVNDGLMTVLTDAKINGKLNLIGATGNDYIGSPIMINGNGNANTIYPTLAFHQPSLYAGTISYRGHNEGFYFTDINGNSLENVSARGFYKSGSDNNYLLLGGGSHRTMDDFITVDSWNNITGKKWFKTDNGNDWDNNTARIQGINGHDAGLTFFRDGIDVGQLIYNGYSFSTQTANGVGYIPIKSSHFIKNGSDENHVLLGDGNDKPISDFALSNQLGNYVTITTPQEIEARKIFRPGIGNSYDKASLEVRGSSANSIYPTISFHQPGTKASVINLQNNGFNFMNADATGYENTIALGFVKNGSSNDYLLLGGGGHDEKNKYIFGSNWTGTIEAYSPDLGLPTTNFKPSKSGFYRPNNENEYGSLLMWVSHSYTTNEYGAGIAFGYGGLEAYLTGTDSVGNKTPNKRIWTSGNLPQAYVDNLINASNAGIVTQNQLNGYVTQTSLIAQLGNYATLNGVQTFTNTITFDQSPIIPWGTLAYHAVNLGQLADYVDNASNDIINYISTNYIPNTHVVNSITSTNISNWNSAFTNSHTHSNKTILDGTQESFTTILKNKLDSLNNYTLPIATSTSLGGVRLITNIQNNIAPNAVSTTIGRSYAIQINNNNQMVVNVPWINDNTTYSNGTGLSLTGTTFSVNYGATAGTSAQGNDSRINNGQTAFGWGNHATAGYTSQSWVQSQNYATSNFVEERIDKLTGEIIDPTPSFSIKNEFTTVILTENFSKEPLELEGELIPERYISIINLTGSKVELTRDHNPIDIIYENETSEYYITKERRLVKKGTYKSAKTLI